MAALKAIVGLGNPGPEYAATRHNVGWWLLDALAEGWQLGRFRRQGNAAVASGRVGEYSVRLLKPLTYMNRSGAALAPLLKLNSFDPARDLLVVVDDVALEPGRLRFRPGGSAGGHNGLKSIESALRSGDYARLRIGVGSAPQGADLANWVLSSPSKADRKQIDEVVPDLIQGVALWMEEGTEAAMNRFNR
ncbi:aminoacyl-tRNA hydrolase [soil metagenome]|nr:aminoacyl-tRNA hydrolase [Gemmatimonadota bacterium]